MIYRLFKVYHTLKEITTIYERLRSFTFQNQNRSRFLLLKKNSSEGSRQNPTEVSYTADMGLSYLPTKKTK